MQGGGEEGRKEGGRSEREIESASGSEFEALSRRRISRESEQATAGRAGAAPSPSCLSACVCR